MKICEAEFDWNGLKLKCNRYTVFGWHLGSCSAAMEMYSEALRVIYGNPFTLINEEKENGD